MIIVNPSDGTQPLVIIRPHNVWAWAAVVFALLAFVPAFVPVLRPVTGLAGLVAVVCGVVGLRVAGRGRWMAGSALVVGVVALVVLLPGAASSLRAALETRTKLAEAREAYKRANYQTAIERFNEVLALDPSNADVNAGKVKAEAALKQIAPRVPERKVYASMVPIPAGEFQMGSNDGDGDEKPVHTVYVDAFYMDQYEVTNALFKTFIDANPQWRKDRIPGEYHTGYYLNDWNGNDYPSGKGDHPVVYVSWYAAAAYAQWAGKRLPTEAEWEKAARGGLVGKTYPWGDEIDSSKANYSKSWQDNPLTTPVVKYPPNGYGLYDMAGNVWEWCMDEYDSGFYAKSPKNNPVAGGLISFVNNNFTNVTALRSLRGGGWNYNPGDVRVADRNYDLPPPSTYSHRGFRCAGLVTP